MAGPRRRLLIYLAALALFLAGTLLAVFLAARLSCPADAAAAAAMRTEKLLALTFDDGPRRSTTSALLDGLVRRGVHATFFIVGSNLDGNEELILRMEAEGHQVGIHSYNHKMLTGLNAADLYTEVGALRDRLTDLLGHDGFLLRPPYGKTDDALRRRAGAPIILWSIDPEDWSDDDSDRQTALILSQVQDGDIILLHDIYPSSVDTALRVVDALLDEGYYFVTVDELFAARGVTPENGKVYRSLRP